MIFFSLYTIKTSKNDFIINLEKLAKWLKTEKRDLKKTLVKSYEKDIDSIIQKEKSIRRPSNLIFITS